MLLLEADRVVPVSRLVSAIWDDAPPVTALGQLQTCVSALRRQLAGIGIPDAIRTVPSGYLIHLAPGELDLGEFERLAATAKAAAARGEMDAAATSYREALSLWDGSALTGCGSRVLDAVAVHLADRRIAVLEDCIEVRMGLGQHHELVSELKLFAAEHPLRERLCGQLMTALQRDGRRAEALEVYRQARRLFIDELGLEPGAAMQEIQRAILDGNDDFAPEDIVPAASAAPAHTRSVPHMLPPDIGDFAGRAADLATLRRLLDEDGSGTSPVSPESSPRIVILTGNGGVGKTALAVHLAHELASRFPDGQLYATMLGGHLRPRNPADVLDTFLRILGVPGSAIPESADERAAIYRDRLAGRRVFIVLDDVATEEQILPLLISGDQAAIIVTSRVRLTTIPGARDFDVGLLPVPDAMAMLEHVLGPERVRAEASDAVTLVSLCEGLPLALRIAAARLAARPHWTIGQLASRLINERRRLDELMHRSMSIRASIAVTYDRLDEDTRRLFRRLAIIDAPDFGKWVAVALLDTDEDKAEDLMESLADMRLLDVGRVNSDRQRYQFHDLIRLYAREQLAAHEPEHERSAALRRLMGSWLCLAREAHRRVYGGDYTTLHSSAEAWPLPQGVIDEELGNPIAWYETERAALLGAVRTTANSNLSGTCWDLAISGVALFETHNYLADWSETHEIALAAARCGGDHRGEGAMLYSLGALALSQGQLDLAADRLEQAQQLFDELGDTHGTGLVQRHLGFIDRVRGNFGSALARYDRAMRALFSAGDVVGRAHVLCNLAQIKTETRQCDEAERLLTSAIEIARQAGCQRVEAQALYKLGESLLERGDHPGARNAFQSVVALARDMGDLVGEAYALHGLGVLHLHSGEYPVADLLLGVARRMATDSKERMLSGRISLAFGELCALTGRPDEAVQHARHAREEFAAVNTGIWINRVDQALREYSHSNGPSAQAG